MEREAITPPLRCFGLEQSAVNPLCVACPHAHECREIMGNLKDRVPVDQVRFNFIPPAMRRDDGQDAMDADPDAEHIDEVYAFCHQWVFDEDPRDRVGRHKGLVLKQVKASDTTLKMFLLSNMLGWLQSHPAQKFYARSLTEDMALRQVKTFAETCYRRFGTFQTTGLDQLFGTDIATKDFETHLLSSEMTAGSWIIGYLMFHDGSMRQRLYADKELNLHPYWLAIEQSYFSEVLSAHIDRPDPQLSDTLRRHRWETSHILGKLKRKSSRASALFSARANIMPEAVRRVLGLRGYQTSHFQVDRREVIVNPLKFWVSLAVAIKQFECIKFVDGIPSAFDGCLSR